MEKTAEDFALYFTMSNEWITPAKSLSEDWADIWAGFQREQEHLLAAYGCSQLKYFIYTRPDYLCDLEWTH